MTVRSGRRWPGLAVVAGVLLAGCGSDEGAQREIPILGSIPPPTTDQTIVLEPPQIADGPAPGAGSGFGAPRYSGDPLASLPATSSTSTLLVSVHADDGAELDLVVIDLADETVTPLDIDRDPHGPVSVDAEGIWYVGPGDELGYVGWDGEAIDDPRVGPLDADGILVWVVAMPGETLAIGFGPGPGSGAGTDEVVVLQSDGTVQCRVDPVEHAWSAVTDGLIQAQDGSVVDGARCSTVSAPVGDSGPSLQGRLADGSALWGGATGLTRSAADGTVLARWVQGSRQEEPWTSVAVDETAIWVTAGAGVVRLEPGTLEPVAEWADLMECGAYAYVVPSADAGWLIDDCDGLLHRLDVRSSNVDEWQFPHDDASDQEIHAQAADGGLWLVDMEQTGEPYFFNASLERFERIPDHLRSDAIFAVDFFVRPGT